MVQRFWLLAFLPFFLPWLAQSERLSSHLEHNGIHYTLEPGVSCRFESATAVTCFPSTPDKFACETRYLASLIAKLLEHGTTERTPTNLMTLPASDAQDLRKQAVELQHLADAWEEHAKTLTYAKKVVKDCQ